MIASCTGCVFHLKRQTQWGEWDCGASQEFITEMLPLLVDRFTRDCYVQTGNIVVTEEKLVH